MHKPAEFNVHSDALSRLEVPPWADHKPFPEVVQATAPGQQGPPVLLGRGLAPGIAAMAPPSLPELTKPLEAAGVGGPGTHQDLHDASGVVARYADVGEDEPSNDEA